MAIFDIVSHVARRDDTAGVQDQPTRLADRALGALETWIDMRTRRERAWLDAVIRRAARNSAPAEMPARAEWWRSWRACKRHRD